MSAIWRNDGARWKLLAPEGFPDEKTLHGLIEDAPQLLPLAGAPRLTIIGREVAIGAGYADLIAIEPSGRVAIIEVKLGSNAEARRAVVAQVLAYAAYLAGTDDVGFEQSVLGPHLRSRGFENLADAVRATDQEGTFDPSTFAAGLDDSLRTGHFRLVFVLDRAPDELVRLVGYLQAMSDKLLIDLVTVASYDINGSMIAVPQRVDPERLSVVRAPRTSPIAPPGQLTDGPDAFAATIDDAPEASRPALRRLVEWATKLERDGLINLQSYKGKTMWTLLPRLPIEDVGLVTIWNDKGVRLSLWRSVFERRAPRSLPRIEKLVAPDRVGAGTYVHRLDDELLQALTDAYREASAGVVSASVQNDV
jgi:hypothetical protein